MSQGLLLLRAVIQSAARTEFRQLREHLFLDVEKPAFNFVTRHYRQFGMFPSPQVMLDGGFVLPHADQPVGYYMERCVERMAYNIVAGQQAALAAAMTARDIRTVREIFTSTARSLNSTATEQDVATLADLSTGVLEDYEHAHLHPGMQGVTLGWDILDELTGGAEGGDVVTFAARPGMGKAQPLSEPVLLPSGSFTTMGDLQIGQSIASPDGSASRVIAIHERGELPVFRVAFDDGRSSLVAGDHLWEVWSSRWAGARTLSTDDIAAAQTGRNKNRMYIRTYSGDVGVDRAPFDPWLLGMIVGDGCVTSRDVTLTIAEPELVTRAQARVTAGYFVRPMSASSSYGYRLTHGRKGLRNHYTDALRELGMMGCGAKEKRLPDVVYSWVREDRLALLQGIMDSDGWVQNGVALVGLTNESLMRDVQCLVRSLGGSMTVHPVRSNGSYRGVVTLSDNPFTLARKADAYVPRTRVAVDRLRIVSVAPEGREVCRCITVDHPSSLYVTRDYIVTHNSWLLCHIALRAWMTGTPVLFVSMEMTGKQIARRVLGMYAGINPDYIRRGAMSDWNRDMVYQRIDELRAGVPFHLLTGSFDKSVPLVDAAIQEFSPGLVCIDASYLMDPATKAMKKSFELVADVAKEIKQVASTRNKPIIQTVQFNREANKAKKRGSEHIGGSDAVGQITTVGVSIKEGSTNFEGVRRTLDLFKNREGEGSYTFETEFLFSPPRFSYIPPHAEGADEPVPDPEALDTMGGI